MTTIYPCIRRVLAVDPSLTCSGWALMSVKADRIIGTGKMRSLPPTMPLSIRLEDLQSRITKLFEFLRITATDVLVCEAPTTMRDPSSVIKVERVRSIFESTGRQFTASVPGRINPRTVHGEILGLRGRQQKRLIVKEAAVHAAFHLYGPCLSRLGVGDDFTSLKKHQDVVDAILVGRVATNRIRKAMRIGIPLEESFSNG